LSSDSPTVCDDFDIIEPIIRNHLSINDRFMVALDETLNE
jgi:hypothetical protein